MNNHSVSGNSRPRNLEISKKTTMSFRGAYGELALLRSFLKKGINNICLINIFSRLFSDSTLSRSWQAQEGLYRNILKGELKANFKDISY